MLDEFIVLVTASPQKTQSHISAMRFVREAISAGSQIKTLFFYQDAVTVANQFNLPPSDEPNLSFKWQQLSEELKIELQTCVAASYRRGVLDETEAKNQSIEAANLDSAFTITGLGQLAAAMSQQNTKMIHFK
jgi:tRNA 2-thiouridine synthesizing protein D